MPFIKFSTTSFFLGTRYARINTYVQTGTDNTVDLELRYLTISSILFKEFYSYKKDRYAERFFKIFEENLLQ